MLVDPSELASESVQIEPLMRLLYEEEEKAAGGGMSDQDKTTYFTLVYLNQRYPNNFLEAVSPIVVDNTPVIDSRRLETLPLKFTNPNVSTRLREHNVCTLFELVNRFNLHSVPHSARSTLVNWYLGNKFDLVLFLNRIPSSKQVLRLQAKSKRCVSLIGTMMACEILIK